MSPLATVRRALRQLAWLRHQFGDLLREERGWLIAAAVMMAGEIAFQVLAPWPIKYLFDALLIPKEGVSLPLVSADYAAQNPGSFVVMVGAALLAFAAGGALCAFYRSIWAATAGQRMVFKLRKRLYLHMQCLPMAYHQQSRMGDLLLRLTGDIPALRDILSESLLELLGRVGTVAAMLIILFTMDSTLAAVSVGSLLAIVLLARGFSKKITGTVRKQRRKEAGLANLTAEGLRGVALVKAYGREKEVVRKFARQNRSSLRVGVKGTRLQAALSGWAEVVFGIGLAVVLAMGALRVGPDSGFTAGDLLVFLSYCRSLNKPLRKISRMTARIAKARACGERVMDVLNETAEEALRPESREAPPLHDSIRLAQVSFQYPDGHRALRGIDLTLEAGRTYGLVGRNGAGKSTLVNLLLGFHDPTEGQVLLDGVDAREYSLRSVREQFTIVPQHTFLFGSSIRDNVHFVAPEASDAEIRNALRVVRAEFVEELPEGLDTPLDEDGSNLSGGQRQKIALAAALLRTSAVLILDEPTAHVDHESRGDIIRQLDRIACGRTTLVVSHDPEMLRAVDLVVYLQGGELVAVDGHQALRERIPSYQGLFEGEPVVVAPEYE